MENFSIVTRTIFALAAGPDFSTTLDFEAINASSARKVAKFSARSSLAVNIPERAGRDALHDRRAPRLRFLEHHRIEFASPDLPGRRVGKFPVLSVVPIDRLVLARANSLRRRKVRYR